MHYIIQEGARLTDLVVQRKGGHMGKVPALYLLYLGSSLNSHHVEIELVVVTVVPSESNTVAAHLHEVGSQGPSIPVFVVKRFAGHLALVVEYRNSDSTPVACPYDRLTVDVNPLRIRPAAVVCSCHIV